MQKSLNQKISELPRKPGVYIYKDAQGRVLYVGKAVRLKDRVSSYFRKDTRSASARIQKMTSQIADMEYAVTNNENESLILENNFIKQLKPKYNVSLRDDKNYLLIKINIKDEIPTIEYDRQTSDRSAKYFGPYTSAQSVRDTLKMIRRIFPYCANSKVGEKPCFYYHIQKCPGVCIGKISAKEYRENYINKIMSFLEGKQGEILKELQGLMKYHARSKSFERAAKVRDQIFALNRVMERQRLVYPKKVDQDMFAFFEDGAVSVNLFIIRGGKLVQKENFILDNTKLAEREEVIRTLLNRYYSMASNLPREIMLPVKYHDSELAAFISSKSGRKVVFTSPVRGSKAKLMKLGEQNAKEYLEAQSDKKLLEEARLLAALRELQRVLDLKDLPARIECFDISNIQGTNPVGSMVVFDYGKPKKDEYRKFKINKKQTPDDFAMMKEMLERRLSYSVEGEGIREKGVGKKQWPLPNLIVIDGGKGQLSAVVSVLKLLKLNIPIIGLAKRLEEIYKPSRPAPFSLPPNSIALFMLQRLRDEAHRFAITYHRKLRSKSAVASVLDDIAGIGPAKKKILLSSFGSASKVRKASLTDIAAIVGRKLAEKIKASI